MPNSEGLSRAQWEKIYKFYRQMPANLDNKFPIITLGTSRGRIVGYTYRQLLLCLCTDDCVKSAHSVTLARIHLLNLGETVLISNACVMRLVNDAYKYYRPFLPHRESYIDKATGNRIFVNRW